MTRFWSKVQKTSGCWLWTGAVNADGYGTFHVGMIAGRQRVAYAHRIAYGLLRGPIPAGLELDHAVCGTRHCVNPAHLDPVTHAVNMQRAARARKRAAEV